MNDRKLELIIGQLLRAGVMLAAAVVLAGAVWWLMWGGQAPVDYHQFHGEVRGLHALVTLPKPEALMLLGLLILIATPVVRVIFSLIAFAMEGDKVYVGLTFAVLAILLYSIGTAWW